MKNRAFFVGLFLLLPLLVLAAPVRTGGKGAPVPARGAAPTAPSSEDGLTDSMRAFLEDLQPAQDLRRQGYTLCVDGLAGIYPCSNVDLLSFLPLADIGGGAGSSIWGWTDSRTGQEYAIMGRSSGTAFVDITDPVNPIYLGDLPTHTYASSWREIKTYGEYAYVVADNAGNHGMQVFDLTQLRYVTDPPVTFAETGTYDDISYAHTLTVNEASGFAYANGASLCSGGLHFIDLSDPTAPLNRGCFSGDGYSHDSQCVIYLGPDFDHQGQEICFASNEDTLTIVDVSDKAGPVQLSRTGYAGSAYTHQGWLTEDHHYFLLDDELDEYFYGHNSRTYVWDVSDLDAPQLIGTYTGPSRAIDHNQFVREGFVYQANYTSGLRVLDLFKVSSGVLTEVGFFDIYPSSDGTSFNAAWGNYPFFPSGVVIVSGIEQGLFVLQPILPEPPPPPTPTPTPIPPGPTFEDVPEDHWAYAYIEALYAGGITEGCSADPLLFCPDGLVTRAQMAVFTLKALYGSGYPPPQAVGVFEDVPVDYWAADWIEKLFADGLTAGCSASPLLYCPDDSLTRAELAVLLLKAEHGAAYLPPDAVGLFSDVPADYWAADWIEQLYEEEITSGCSLVPLLFCPEDPVTRAQMAVFLVKTFDLPLP